MKIAVPIAEDNYNAPIVDRIFIDTLYFLVYDAIADNYTILPNQARRIPSVKSLFMIKFLAEFGVTDILMSDDQWDHTHSHAVHVLERNNINLHPNKKGSAKEVIEAFIEEKING